MGQAAGVAGEGLPGRESVAGRGPATVIGAGIGSPGGAPLEADRSLLVVFGASGGTGLAIVEVALQRGYAVRAFVRNKEKLGRELGELAAHERLEVMHGDLEDLDAVKSAIKGARAVISVAGAAPETAKGPMTAAVPAMVEGCRRHGVRKLIVQAGALSAAPGEWLGLLSSARLSRNVVRWQIGSSVVDDNDRVLQYLYDEVRDLNWVASRPAFLEDGESVGTLCACLDTFRPATIRYVDVADWTVEQVDSDRYVGKMPRLYYPPVKHPI
ncbi:unnamed protein product [Prorocentrum cordatum]|uniref:NAD(P)-binding domain-containing protein n=1 Tax=Prorocentrum cordatum TaxID=2364126 RepID=A0ABN9UCZ0_9DINO|nr:unnamed protein product [Polarella glacialis]|mmetsp:Transcript_43574/g.117037  ORF Transcript_43574/g.117037 Transcript_43574/m.117037 type:complete len:270 (+) Transcript_43574:77-886(+)